MPDRQRQEFDRAAMVHLPELLRVAIRVCRARDAADDLIQETYLHAWRSFHHFEPGTNCRAWLYKIMFNCLARDRRTRQRRPALVELDAATEEALRFDPATPDMLTVESVKAAFERLPDPFRTVVLLVDIEQLTYREAADALGIPIGTVMSRLNRGRRLLRTDLAAHAEAAGIGPAATADRKARVGS